jgi:DNA polymerase-3 subunit chi
LVTSTDNFVNTPHVVFLVDRAPMLSDVSAFERVVLMFDGQDDDALVEARVAWKDVRGKGLESTYWQQDENGRWQKKA